MLTKQCLLKQCLLMKLSAAQLERISLQRLAAEQRRRARLQVCASGLSDVQLQKIFSSRRAAEQRRRARLQVCAQGLSAAQIHRISSSRSAAEQRQRVRWQVCASGLSVAQLQKIFSNRQAAQLRRRARLQVCAQDLSDVQLQKISSNRHAVQQHRREHLQVCASGLVTSDAALSHRIEAARKKAVERFLRRQVGLTSTQPVHPRGIRTFRKLIDATSFRRALIEKGDFRESQLGIFAQEIALGGARYFIVDSYAGFVLEHAPSSDPDTYPTNFLESQKHLYEVIIDSRPCWLYFDLEYDRKVNLGLHPAKAMEAFRRVAASFCENILGADLDERSMLELDSTTDGKFSMHVVIKRFKRQRKRALVETGDATSCCHIAQDLTDEQELAFVNNAQAGLIVRKLIDYARSRQHDPESLARHLFVAAPRALGEHASTYTAKEVCIIDDSVYSRNRCFRLAYNTKFGKSAVLRIAPHCALAIGKSPAARMLSTMASFVPKEAAFFRHSLIPMDHQHYPSAAWRPYRNCDGGAESKYFAADPVHHELLQYLLMMWDEVRQANEPPELFAHAGPTRVQSCMTVGDDQRLLNIKLLNNRFCFRKGASHKSNSIFLVVDQDKHVFHQKCYDRADCGGRSSPDIQIPDILCEDSEDRELWDLLSSHS